MQIGAVITVFHPQGELHVRFSDQAVQPTETQLQEVLNRTVQPAKLTVPSKFQSAPWAAFAASLQIVHAAGGVVFNAANELLVIQRLGHWDLPKGKVDPGESFPTAAVREVAEETGVSGLQRKEALSITYHIYARIGWVLKPTHWYRMRCPGRPLLVPQAEEGITAADWKPLPEVNAHIGHFFPAIQALLKTHGLAH